ncbi:MAG TPA: ABC transporter substrate-binding protein [Vicinamibacterales bacterium]|nr:ABC transporter substrate-binding protein [Vicinamibacterales bacterium]
MRAGLKARAPVAWATVVSATIAILFVVRSAAPQACIMASASRQEPSPRRIISLIPAATEMLFAVGAGPRVVAVGSYDRYPPEVSKLPTVGALIDPNVERILSLKPDLVVIYASQTDLKRQLARAGITVFEYRHAGLADVTETIRALGARTGNAADANAVAGRIEHDLDDIRVRVRVLPRPRTLLVFGREPGSLRGLYASGGIGFLNDMLEIAGGANVFASVRLQAVQASTEQVLAARPDVILEVRASNDAFPTGRRGTEMDAWRTLASVPAVKNGRVVFLFDDRIVVPGPRVAEGTRLLAKTLHPDAFR